MALNAAGTLLACAACGAQADFDGSVRRVRYTEVPQAYAQFDGALRNRWLTRTEVFDAVAAIKRPRAKHLWPWGSALALLIGAGVIGLVVALVRGLPAQPRAGAGSARTTEGPSASALSSASTVSIAAPTSVNTPIASATEMLSLATAPPTDVSITRQFGQDVTTTPSIAPVATRVSLPTQTAQPQAKDLTALPTVDAQRSAPVAATQPASTRAPATTAPSGSSTLSVNTPLPAQEPLPIGAIKPTEAATLTAEPVTPTPTPTEFAPTETLAPTETPVPTPTFTPTPTPVPATFSISKIAYVGGSAFEEYLELTNATDQVLELALQTWKLRISTTVGEAELKLGSYLTATISMPARQSCRIYTSKRAASVDEVSPCGFLSLGIVDDVDGIYPDKPGATVTLMNGESQTVALFRY